MICMKNDKRLVQYHTDDPGQIYEYIKKSRFAAEVFTDDMDAAFPFNAGMLKLLRYANPLKQSYYYIEDDDRYAFFTSYLNRMNLFTFGKARLFINLQTIAFPCSLSCSGYITNDPEWMLEYIKTIKGCKLVLNADMPFRMKGMVFGETLPTCRLKLRDDMDTVCAYMRALRSSYRRRINLAVKNCSDISMRRISDDSIDVHPLYLQTYERSEYKLECLSKGFFDKTEGEKIVFLRDDKPLGFVLLKVNGDELVFMLCGMEYKDSECNADLYWFMLYNIVAYAIEHGCKQIDFGQTSEKTKLKFGALLEKRYFYAHHSNPVINFLAMAFKSVLEYKYSFPEYRVFKDEA